MVIIRAARPLYRTLNEGGKNASQHVNVRLFAKLESSGAQNAKTICTKMKGNRLGISHGNQSKDTDHDETKSRSKRNRSPRTTVIYQGNYQCARMRLSQKEYNDVTKAIWRANTATST